MDLEVFVTRGLGDATYLVASEGEALVVDPQRDAERFLSKAERHGWRIVGVLETHVHNDYLSGALEIRARTGALIHAPARGGYTFDHRPVDEGDSVEVGALRVVARATPGHTFEHLTWDVHEEGERVPAALLTGGSLLIGSVGRTDLLGPERTAELTALQYRTVRRLATLPDSVKVLPTHGSGSFCAAGPVVHERVTTLGVERTRNPLLAAPDEPTFAARLLSGLGEYPAYYSFMAPINRAGPALLADQALPVPLAPAAVVAAVANGAHVVDARDRVSFARAHLPGSWNIELNETFAAYVGWMLPFDAPLVLVLPDPVDEAAREAQIQLSRIGFDHVVGRLDGGLDAWQSAGRPVSSYPTLSARRTAAAQAAGESMVLLDVRQPNEWRDEGTVPGARQVFVADLRDRLAELPHGVEITVLCKSGSRAAIAASLLDREGIPVRLVAAGGAAAWRQPAVP